jgi:urease accessory protein
VQLELKPDRLQFEPDPVLADMLRHMHLIVTQESAPFEPEAGAYASHGGQVHDHGHDHGHRHDHDDGHGQDHGHSHGHDH